MYLQTQPMLSRRQARWSEYLQMYDFKCSNRLDYMTASAANTQTPQVAPQVAFVNDMPALHNDLV